MSITELPTLSPIRQRTLLFAVLSALLAGAGAAQNGLPPELYFHAPSWSAVALGQGCLDTLPQPRGDSSFSTGGSGNADFDSQNGNEPSTDCAAFPMPAEVRAGTRFLIYFNATLTGDYSTLEVALEVDDPSVPAIVQIDRVTQNVRIGWNLFALQAADDVPLGAGSHLRVRMRHANILTVVRFDLDRYQPADPNDPLGLVGPQGYAGIEIIEPPRTELLVGNFLGEVLRFDGRSGAFFDDLVPAGSAGLDVALGLATGPEGHLYVSSRDTDNILKFHRATGEFLGRFNPGAVLNEPTGLTFGPDGLLYAGSGVTNGVLRFDVTTGRFVDFFTAGGPLDVPEGVIFGPDGHLYVASQRTDQVLRYDGQTGAFIDVFASGGGIDGPAGLVFGPDGHLYVAGIWSSNVVRFDGRTGAFIDVFASGGGIDRAISLQFGPEGHLYVVSQGNDRVLRFDGRSGAFIDVFASGSGTSAFTWMIFRPASDPGAIFSDGFESGNVARWSRAVP